MERIALFWGTLILTSVLLAVIAFGDLAIKDKITAKYSVDINKDGKKELLIHDFYGGTAGYGELKIYTSNGRCLFSEKVEGDTYLWHPQKHCSSLNPDYFPDLDRDGIVEILVGYRGKDVKFSHVDEPWWFDVYKWNGRTYILADERFPGFYREEVKYYRVLLKEKGKSETVKRFLKKAEGLANL
jgi:hypothetical protein